ncbi:hypothetical protein EDD15DRAFT_1552487 [Pisolithus albus]|nr:hypothetical protein EDD15DRAFT_1552487 [Pisolithus albus]
MSIITTLTKTVPWYLAALSTIRSTERSVQCRVPMGCCLVLTTTLPWLESSLEQRSTVQNTCISSRVTASQRSLRNLLEYSVAAQVATLLGTLNIYPITPQVVLEAILCAVFGVIANPTKATTTSTRWMHALGNFAASVVCTPSSVITQPTLLT